METGGPSALEIILLVLAAPVVVLLAIYGLVLLWQKKTRETVSDIGERIKLFDSRIQEISSFLHFYQRVDQEPYATMLDELQKEASGLQTRVESFIDTCQAFIKETEQPGANRLLDIFNAPLKWFTRWRRSGGLLKESKEIETGFTSTEERMQRIYELPLDLSKQCIQVEKDANELFQAAQNLQLKGVSGPALVQIANQIPQLRRGLDEIPAIFFETGQEPLLAADNLPVTIHVYEVLNRLTPALSRYLPQVREWNTTYDKAAADYAELKIAGAGLRQAMEKPPQGLIIDTMQERLDQIAQMAADLNQRLNAPKVEDLKPLSREISQLRRVIQDADQQLSRARQQVNELGQVLEEMHSGLEKLSKQISDLEHIEFFPLAWDTSSSLLSDLRKRLQSLGPAQQPRTPEQITQHLKELEGIRAGHKTHAEAFPKIAEQHRALLALLDSSEIKDGSTWLRQAREMLNQAGIYDPRNWPKQDSIQTLPVELDELARLHESLIPADRSAPVLESELGQRLKDTQQLAAQHKRLRPRIESVRARLAKVQALETEGKEKLTESYTALERVAILADNDDLLNEIASNEIERLSDEIRQLGNEINGRAQGEIDKKSQKINAQAEKVNKALNGWLARMNAAIAELGIQMNGLLIHLDGIAQIEDSIFADTRDLLSRDEYVSAIYGSRGSGGPRGPSRPTGASSQTGGLRGVAAKVAERGGGMLQRQPQLTDLEATAEIKRKNDLWLTLNAVQQQLTEKTEALLAAYDEAINARNAAQEELAEVNKRVPERRAWPPTNQAPLVESQLLQPIDARREALKKQPRRVEALILELGRLAQQYQHAAEHARQVLDRVAQDEERIQDLEEQVSEIKERWQATAQTDPGNPVMREGVRQLISQADSKLAYIKQQYMRGSLSYEQAIRSLQLLYDELFTSRVSIDDKNDIGLNETHAADNKRPVNQN